MCWIVGGINKYKELKSRECVLTQLGIILGGDAWHRIELDDSLEGHIVHSDTAANYVCEQPVE